MNGKEILGIGILVGISWVLFSPWLGSVVPVLLILVSLGLIFSGIYLGEAEK